MQGTAALGGIRWVAPYTGQYILPEGSSLFLPEYKNGYPVEINNTQKNRKKHKKGEA